MGNSMAALTIPNANIFSPNDFGIVPRFLRRYIYFLSTRHRYKTAQGATKNQPVWAGARDSGPAGGRDAPWGAGGMKGT